MVRNTRVIAAVLLAVGLLVAGSTASASVTAPLSGAEASGAEEKSPLQIQEDPRESFNVSSFWTVSAVSSDGELTASALVGNPNEFSDVQTVEFRFAGEVVERMTVELGAGDRTTVAFEVDIANVTAGADDEPATNDTDESDPAGIQRGAYVAGIYTRNEGEEAQVTVGASFTVGSVEVPSRESVGSNVPVRATVENPNDFSAVQVVTLRYKGTVVRRIPVELSAGESTTLRLPLDSGTEQGRHVVGVFTAEHGQYVAVTLTEEGNTTSP